MRESGGRVGEEALSFSACQLGPAQQLMGLLILWLHLTGSRGFLPLCRTPFESAFGWSVESSNSELRHSGSGKWIVSDRVHEENWLICAEFESVMYERNRVRNFSGVLDRVLRHKRAEQPNYSIKFPQMTTTRDR